MSLLQTTLVRLRALEPSDLETLYKWENDTAVWGVSHTLTPFSRSVLRRFIEEQTKEIYVTGQMRLMIESIEDGRPLGTIDLFDYDPVNLRAGVGILIYDKEDRGNGYASEALAILLRYSFEIFGLYQLYCNIGCDNEKSIRLFEKAGFKTCGVKKGWMKTASGWRDEIMMQVINPQFIVEKHG